MGEPSIEKTVPEADFANLLAERGAEFLEGCAADADVPWTKRRFFDLYVASDELESFLDDYGARTNRTFSVFTELVASLRGFGLAGMSLSHLVRRLPGYGVLDRLGDRRVKALDDLGTALVFVEDKIARLMGALLDEGRAIGVTELRRGEGQPPVDRSVRRFRLPHDVDLDRTLDEEQRIAEVVTNYLEAAGELERAGIRPIADPREREAFLRSHCSEEVARVREATVHNLQSSYDTYVKTTVLETADDRLPALRGHIAAALHTLEAVTALTHFVERHERGLRSDLAEAVLQRVVPRDEVRAITLDHLLAWAREFMTSGVDLAEGLLPSYTNEREVTLTLKDGVVFHARPASFVVSIVQHHGTPVELEVEGEKANAGSILDLMVVLGSHPDARSYVVRGDERPIRDLEALFAADLGEMGMEKLPDSLGYLGQ